MLAIRSALYNIFFYTLAVVLTVVWLPLMAIGSRGLALKGFHILVGTALWGLKVICRTRIDIRGLENLPKDQPVLIASKHQSLWDILVFFHVIRNPAFVAKLEVRKIPILGYFSKKVGTIAVDREAGAKALKYLIDDARSSLDLGRSVIIFPEGTRAEPGGAPDYKPGIAALYTRLDTPCVPVALNSGSFWPRRKFLRMPGTVVMEFLPAIETGLSRKAFMGALETSIEEASNRLLEEARQSLPD